MALQWRHLPGPGFCALIFLTIGCSTVIEQDEAAQEATPSVETFTMDEPVQVENSLSDGNISESTRTAESISESTKDSAEEESSLPDELSCPETDSVVLHVDALAPDNGNGLSWDTALSKIQPAIDKASEISSACRIKAEVWVKAGRYYLYTSNEPYGLLVRENVQLYGGFLGKEVSVSDRNLKEAQTVLDARADDVSELRLSHIAVAEDAAALDGFTLTGAYAGDDNLSGKGSAVVISGAGVILRNNVFMGNVSRISGGAVYATDSVVTIENCRFEANFSDGDGGALTAENSTLVITRSEFADNGAAGFGGAIQLMNVSLSVEKSIFSGNNALGGGAVSGGEGSFASTNSLYTDNTAFYGGAWYVLNGENLQLLNCTFADNYAQASGASLMVDIGDNDCNSTVINNIFAGGYPTEIEINDHNNENAVTTVEWNAVEGGYAGTGNMDVSPEFAPNSFELTEESPCVDAALDEMAPGDDINGEPRISADMGAFEL